MTPNKLLQICQQALRVDYISSWNVFWDGYEFIREQSCLLRERLFQLHSGHNMTCSQTSPRPFGKRTLSLVPYPVKQNRKLMPCDFWKGNYPGEQSRLNGATRVCALVS